MSLHWIARTQHISGFLGEPGVLPCGGRLLALIDKLLDLYWSLKNCLILDVQLSPRALVVTLELPKLRKVARVSCQLA